MKLKAAPIFNHVWVWMNARIPVSVFCFEWQKVHRTYSTTLSDLSFSVDLRMKGRIQILSCGFTGLIMPSRVL